MANELDVGGYEIKSCIITSYDGEKKNDIASIIASFTINEGIKQQAITGAITVGDTMGFIDEFPVLGEETVEITYKDFYEDEETIKFRIYSIESLSTDYKGQLQGYVIRLHSPDFMKSEVTEIRKSYKGVVSESAQEVFEEYFTETEKELDIEDTTNSKTFVIPALTPYETMNFLAKKSFTDEKPGCDFKFFETREKYYFKTIEQIIEDKREEADDEKKTFSYVESNVEFEDRGQHMQNLMSFTMPNRFNIVNEIRSGAQVSETIVLDLATKTYETNIYKHKDELDSYTHVDESIADYHTGKFIEENFEEENVVKTYIVFDDSSEDDDTFYQDVIPRRVSNHYYLNSMVMNAKMYGRVKLHPGDVVELNIPNIKYNKTDSAEHPRISGYWLVDSIQHMLQDKQWVMNVTLLKDALKGD